MKLTPALSAAIGGLALVSACSTLPEPAANSLVVSKSCDSEPNCFTSVQAAIDAAEQMSVKEWATIRVSAGDFYEKVTIARPKLRLSGAGQGETRIYFDAVARDSRKYHRNNWGTPGSATLTINADEVTVRDLTVSNTYDYLSNDALGSDNPDRNRDPQAVALLLDIESDRVHMNGVALEGYQDTLFANGDRFYFENGFISGNVDFIFGNGFILIENSTIESRIRATDYPEGEIQSFIMAPSTQLDQPIGLVIANSKLTREEGLADRSVTLGRPWHPTTTFDDGRYADPDAVGSAIFIDNWMDAHIHEDRWSTMNGTARDGSKTDIFRPEDSRFHESGSTGPGARTTETEISWTLDLSLAEIRALMFEGWDLDG